MGGFLNPSLEDNNNPKPKIRRSSRGFRGYRASKGKKISD